MSMSHEVVVLKRLCNRQPRILQDQACDLNHPARIDGTSQCGFIQETETLLIEAECSSGTVKESVCDGKNAHVKIDFVLVS